MMDYFPIPQNRKFPEPAPEPEPDEEAVQDATVDVVLNVYKEKRDGQSIALHISFRLPENK
jgi:hypothetical protein